MRVKYAGLRRMFIILKHSSQSKRKWFIDFECFRRLASQSCHYCGKPPSQKAYAAIYSRKEKQRQDYTRFDLYNGLDRVNNDIDYVEENLVPCCKNCNFAKRNMTVEEFRKWAVNLYHHQFGDQKPSNLQLLW
jgi:hypothetical protein